MGLGSAIVSGLGDIATGLVNTFTGQKMSKDLMDYQYQLQQKGIEDQRFYNSPEQQMIRLANAGLNPNLVYGSGVDGNQSAAASPGIVNRRGEFTNPLNDAVQQYNMERQLQMAEIRTRNEAFESRERQLNLRAKTLGQLYDNDFNSKTLQYRIRQEAQKLANSLQQQHNMEANEALTWSRTRNEDNRLENILAERDLIKSRTNLTDEQALTEPVRRSALNKGIELTNAQISQISSYIEFLEAGTELRKGQRDIQITEYEAKKAYKEWRAKHPNASLTFDMIKELLGIGQQISSIIP